MLACMLTCHFASLTCLANKTRRSKHLRFTFVAILVLFLQAEKTIPFGCGIGDNMTVTLCCRFLERPADTIAVPHIHKLANSTHASAPMGALTPASNSDVSPFISSAPMNPQQLNLVQYMTPMASLLAGVPFG